jgi:hypothetical protein
MRRTGDRSPTLGWRIPASSSLGARWTLWPRPEWPPPHPPLYPRRAPAPPRRASPLSYAAVGAVSSAASAALGKGGEGSHLSGRARPPSLSSSSSPDDESSDVAKGESPCCSRSRNSSSRCSLALPPPDPLLFLARHPLLLPPLHRACARAGAGRGLVRPRGVHGHHLQRASETPGHDDAL